MTSDREVPSDAKLLARSGKDPACFGEFYDRHFDNVLGYFYRRVASRHTAADLTAETFSQAFLSRARFRDRGVPATAWLYKIAQRQLSHYLRREAVAQRARKRLHVERIDLAAVELEEVERLLDARKLRDVVRSSLNGLSPGVRAAVEFRVLNQLPFREVARRLECSEGAARVRVSRGLSQLADILESTP